MPGSQADTVFAVARRLDIELTSDRGDGQWTWRAAGAKQPKGTLDGTLLPAGTSVGDVVKVEADADLDGLTVTTVLRPRALARKPRRSRCSAADATSPWSLRCSRRRAAVEAVATTIVDVVEVAVEAVTATTVVEAEAVRWGTPWWRRPPQRAAPPPAPEAAGPSQGSALASRSHPSQAALKALPTIQQPLAEEVLKGGVPGVRQAIDRMNDKATAEGMPKIKREPLVALAEKLAPTLKAAEWRSPRLRLRASRPSTFATSAPWWSRPTEPPVTKRPGRLLTNCRRTHQPRRCRAQRLARRTCPDHRRGRTVRALRLSSRPPKAGAPLPIDMAERLAAAASESLTSEVTSDRYATVIDAVAFSPSEPGQGPGVPTNPSDELTKAVTKLAGRIPQIAALFGIEAPAQKPRGKAKRPTPPPPPQSAAPTPPSRPCPPRPLLRLPARRRTDHRSR